MNRKTKLAVFILLAAIAVLLLIPFAIRFLSGSNIAVLNPKGTIAQQESDLIKTAVLLMLIVVVPVYILLFVFARRYRVGNVRAEYDPDLDQSKLIGFAWWAVPIAVISVLAVINWKSTHTLDPYRTIESATKPLMVQVVALQWKWLFIYPEQNIATVNFLEFPERTPINFALTSDAPMNTFWIPQLGGQVYAMSGMSTQLHLMADETGEFRGSSAEISGQGFSGMKFIAKSTSQADFDQWVRLTKQSSATLSLDAYNKLAEPSENNPRVFYASVEKNLYNSVIMKFTMQM